MGVISKGDSVFHLPSQVYFIAHSKNRNPETGAISFVDEQGNRYLDSECVPDCRFCPLDTLGSNSTGNTALDTLNAILEAMLASGILEIDLLVAGVEAMVASQGVHLSWLERLPSDWKRQLWVALSVGQREALKAAKGRVAA